MMPLTVNLLKQYGVFAAGAPMRDRNAWFATFPSGAIARRGRRRGTIIRPVLAAGKPYDQYPDDRCYDAPQAHHALGHRERLDGQPLCTMRQAAIDDALYHQQKPDRGDEV